MGICLPKKKNDESSEIDLVRNRTDHVVHLTHNDLDAAGADAIHRMTYGKVVSVFSSVGKFPYILEGLAEIPGNGDVISISDIGFPRNAERLLKKLKANGWSIEWRDHHRWTDEEIATVRNIVDLLHIDTSLCGCGICARDLQPANQVAAEVARVVCDYDLWKHEDPRSAVLGEVLQRRKNLEHVRDCLSLGIFSDRTIEEEYAEIHAEMQRLMEKSRKKAVIMGEKYHIVFAPLYGYPSETAAYLRKSLKSDIEVIISSGGRFSIRSVPPISHLVAREFHGGGHPHAAGGNFDFGLKDKILFYLFRKNEHFDRLVTISESL
ncbi:MAG TPA: phosphoesterase [Methanoregulaceae archaeon]|nr:phosphoesterase [Methanoregulaceae archaeon]